MVFDLQNNCDSLNFKTMDDEVIVELAKSDNPGALEYIISKYKSFVRTKARAYFLVGADNDDIVQEGMIGLYKAIRDYDKHKLTSFRSFAEICITRQIITAIKSATRQKHIPLNFYVSLNKPVYEEESERTLEDIISGNKATDPMELFIGREDMDIMESKIGEVLSELEMEVLMSYIDGKTYQEIAEDLNRDVKSVDNALQRVKRKLERFLSSK
ncbi:MAG: RNA polymerase sporulation sigma factor SigH [Thermotaleaceae bacterium]